MPEAEASESETSAGTLTVLFQNGLGGVKRSPHSLAVPRERIETTAFPWYYPVPSRRFPPLTREDGSSFTAPGAFGSFRVMHQIGVGVLGPVFRTYDPEGDRLVAVKAFHLDLTPESAERLVEALRRFVDAGLSHRAVVTPLAAGLEAGIPYLAQEYVAAESLDVAMRHYAPAIPERALPFIAQLSSAVDAAHDRGVLHGGLHLRDVFVTPDEARATGFGVARALEEVGLRVPVRRPYSAPELVAGRGWGPEADRFAVAAVAYELLTSKRAAGSGAQVIEGLEVVDVGDHGDRAALSEAFAGALADDPASRPSTAAEFVIALGEAVGVPTDAPPALRASDAHAAADSARIADLLEHIGPPPAAADGRAISADVGRAADAAPDLDGAPADELTTDLAALDRTLDQLEPLRAQPFDGEMEPSTAPLVAFDASSPGVEEGGTVAASGDVAPMVDGDAGVIDGGDLDAEDLDAEDADTGTARSVSPTDREVVSGDDVREPRLPLSDGPADDGVPPDTDASQVAAELAEVDVSRVAAEPAEADVSRVAAELAEADVSRVAAELAEADVSRVAAELAEADTISRSVVPPPAMAVNGPTSLGDAAMMSQDDDALDSHVRPDDVSPNLLDPIDSADRFDPLDPLDPLDIDEPPPSRTSVRAMMPFALAAVIGVLVAYVAALGFGIELPFGGSGAAPQVDEAQGGGEPAVGERDWSEGTVAGVAADATTVDSSPSPVPPALPVQPAETEARSERARRETPAQAEPVPPVAVARVATPSPAAAPARAAETPAAGWLLVRTTPPGASVLVDGVDRGQTPLSLRDVAYGTHRVEIRTSGYEPETHEVSLSATTTVASISAELSPEAGLPPAPRGRGSVFVDSRPAGARVLVNDAAVGLTPVLVPDLAPGTHRLRIERDGYQPWVTTVDVPSADRVRVTASLDPAGRR